jgi:hypothetical protein
LRKNSGERGADISAQRRGRTTCHSFIGVLGRETGIGISFYVLKKAQRYLRKNCRGQRDDVFAQREDRNTIDSFVSILNSETSLPGIRLCVTIFEKEGQRTER